MNVLDLKLGKAIANQQYPTLMDLVRDAPSRIYPQLVDQYPELHKIVLDVRRVTHTLSAGKIFRFRVVAAVGNPGILGVGVGKGDTVANARDKAITDAKKRLILIRSRLERGVTKYTPVRTAFAKKGSTIVTVFPLRQGTSVTSSPLGKLLCRLAKITNIGIRVGNKGRERKGRAKSRLNYYTALHQALTTACR